MAIDARVSKLIEKWLSDSEGFRGEARRLEQSDRSRHEAEITILETRAQAIERCILELEKLTRSEE